MRKTFKFILLLLIIQAASVVSAEEQGELIFEMTSSYQRPTNEELSQKAPPTYPKLMDVAGVERFIFWNGIQLRPSKDKAIDELKKNFSAAILSSNKNFFLLKSDDSASVQLNVLVERKEEASIEAALLDDWLREDDFRVSDSKASVLSAIKKEMATITIDKPVVISFLINNKVQISNMALYDFTGVCGRIYPASLRRKNKGMDINFDFTVMLDGKAKVIRKKLIEDDDEILEAFDKWIGGCFFNPKYFAGKQYSNKRIRINLK